MKRSNINYKGINYHTIEIALSKVSDIESNEVVTIADYELWAAIEGDCEFGNQEAVCIDNEIYFYCDSGFIASNPTENEVIDYMHKYQ